MYKYALVLLGGAVALSFITSFNKFEREKNQPLVLEKRDLQMKWRKVLVGSTLDKAKFCVEYFDWKDRRKDDSLAVIDSGCNKTAIDFLEDQSKKGLLQ